MRHPVDECPNCGGIWLDYGELAGIEAALQDRAASPEKSPKAVPLRQVGQYLAALRPARK